MKVVVSAGGTGGHIYPAISIINKLKEEYKNLDLLYIGTVNRMESDIIPKLGILYVGIDISGINRANLISNFSVLNKYIKAKRKVKKILKEFNPDIVIGAGGYVSAPVLKVAHKLGIKTLIHEQNSSFGITNKMASKYVDCVCSSFQMKNVKTKKLVYTGNPRSQEIINVKKLKKQELGFIQNKKLVVIVMGSLGSTTMTKKLKETLSLFKSKTYQVLLITGKNYYDDYKDIKLEDNVKIVPFMNNLINLLKDTDILVSRAGASTIAEICAIGLPTIMVPSPYVTENHQYKNAKALEDKNACVIIEEKDFNSETLIKEIDNLLNDEERYNDMKNNLLKLGVKDSSSKILECIKELVGD